MVFHNILVPTDFSEPAMHAADVASELARATNARLTLLHVWSVDLPSYAEAITVPRAEVEQAARKALSIEKERLAAAFPRLEELLVAGVPWQGILDAVRAYGFDLVVMGTHARKGVSRLFLGSVTSKLVRTCSVPVLTVRGAP